MMNLWLLFVLLLLLLLLFFKISNGLVCSPSVIYCATYVFAVFICLCSGNWIFNPTIDTVLTIVFGVLIFGITQIFAKRVRIRVFNSTRNCVCGEHLQFKVLFAFVSILCLVLYATFIVSIGDGISLLTIMNARTWMLYHDPPLLYGHVMLLSRALGCIYVFLATNKKVNYGQKLCLFDVVPIVSYLLMEILSSSRSGIIYFMGYIFVCVLIVLYKKSKGSFQFSKQEKKIIIRIVIIVALAFLILGNLTGKTSKLGVTNMISVYFGGSIYNLDYYLGNINSFESPSFGYFTMPIVNSVKSILGIQVPVVDEFYLPFVPIRLKYATGLQTTSNLYSSLTKPILDFGVSGAVFFWIIIGTIYSFIFYYVLRKENNGMEITIFSYLMMPVFCASSEYVFGSFLFSPSALYTFIYIFIVFKLITVKIYNN